MPYTRFKSSCAKVSRCSFDVVCLSFRRLPAPTALLIGASAAQGLMPVVTLWITKHLVDATTACLAGEATLWPVVKFAGIQLLQQMAVLLLGYANTYSSSKLSRYIGFYKSAEILRLCLRQDLAFFESPETRDKLSRAQSLSAQASQTLLSTCFSIGQRVVTFGSACVALVLFSPLLCLVAAMVAIPAIAWNMRLAFVNYELIKQRTQRVRRAGYFAGLLTNPVGVRESVLLGLGDYFLRKWEHFRRLEIDEDLRMQQKRTTAETCKG